MPYHHVVFFISACLAVLCVWVMDASTHAYIFYLLKNSKQKRKKSVHNETENIYFVANFANVGLLLFRKKKEFGF